MGLLNRTPRALARAWGREWAPSRALRGPSGPRSSSAALAQPLAQGVVELGHGADLLHGGLDVVGDAAELEGVAVEQHVAGPRVAVARLADAADVAEGLAAVEPVDVLDLVRGVELVQVFGRLSVKMPGTCVCPWKQ